MQILIIQHLDIEPPALIGEQLRRKGCRLQALHLDRGDRLPPMNHSFDGVVIMGGPQSANDDHVDYIAAELTWLTTQIKAGLPMLGICLGAQLMARAAGGTILTSPLRELGWYRVLPTSTAASDPLFSALPDEGITLFQWHGETFSLPKSAALVATSPDVPHQAFRLGAGQYGMQFHAEVDRALINQWIAADSDARQHLGTGGIDAVQCVAPQQLSAMHKLCRRITDTWLAQVSNSH